MAEIDKLLEPGEHWLGDPGEHPSEEAWEGLACGELPEDERLALVDHVTGCARCARIYRALSELEAGARSLGGAPAGPVFAVPPDDRPAAAPKRYGWYAGLAAAAALALVFVGVRGPSAPSPDPSGSPPPVRAAQPASVVLLAPLGEVDAPPPEFRWAPVDGAVSYRLELLDADGERIAAQEVVQPRAGWPGSVPPSQASAGGRYYWRVVAALERGGSVASELADFEVVAAPR